MYIPVHFAQPDTAVLLEFIERHPFGLLVSAGGAEPLASHLPLMVAQRDQQMFLIGHFARANSHWKPADGQPVLAIFLGPHAYISPTWYQSDQVVPTWNYVAVHVSGTLRIIGDRAQLRQQISRLIDKMERAESAPWSLDSQPAEFIDRMLGGVVGFEIAIDRLEGKWKLSQNHALERRQRVIDALRAQGDATSLAMAEWMEAAR